MPPEPLSLTAAITGLVITAYNLSKATCSTISAIKNAPKHISDVRRDLTSFYNVLATLQQILDDSQVATKGLQLGASENLQTVLEDCITLFTKVQTLVNNFTTLDGNEKSTTWRRIRWNFKETEVNGMKKELTDRKLTLNTELLVAIFYNLRTTNLTRDTIENEALALQKEEAEYRRELEEKLPTISKELEDLQAAQLPDSSDHSELDRAGVRFDASYTLRHYINSAASILTEAHPPPSPSMQVSSIDEDQQSIETITISDQLSDRLSFKTAQSYPSNPTASPQSANASGTNTSILALGHVSLGQQTAGESGIVTRIPVSSATLQLEAWIQIPGAKPVKVQMRHGDKIGDLKERARRMVEVTAIDFESNLLSYKGQRLLDNDSIDRFICTTTPTFWLREPVKIGNSPAQIIRQTTRAFSTTLTMDGTIQSSVQLTQNSSSRLSKPDTSPIKKRRTTFRIGPMSKQRMYRRIYGHRYM